MIKIFILLFVSISLTIPSKQNSLKANEAKGYYITLNNDTVYAQFKVPYGLFSSKVNKVSLQSKVTIIESNGKKKIIKPNEVIKVYFRHDYRTYELIACKNTIGLFTSIGNSTGYIFLELKTEGPLMVYNYYYKQNTGGSYNGTTWRPGTSYTEEKYIFQKKEQNIFRPRKLTFKKDMSEYFSDYPELAQKILDKELKAGDIDIIISEYNRWAKNNNKQ